MTVFLSFGIFMTMDLVWIQKVMSFSSPEKSSVIPLNLPENKLAVGEQKSWNFKAPANGTILLSLEARIDWEKLAGSAFIMELTVNDVPITGERLINKPFKVTFADGQKGVYYGKSPTPYWMLFYSPSYEANSEIGSGYRVLEGQACLYIFDLTSLVKPGQVNKITLYHRGEYLRDILNRPIPLNFRQVKILQN